MKIMSMVEPSKCSEGPSSTIDASLFDADEHSAAEGLLMLREQKILSPDITKDPQASVEGEGRLAKRVKKMSSIQQSPEQPDLPIDFKSRIQELTGSVEAVFVFEKLLYKSDVNPGQNRLLIPFKKVKNNFLTEEEKRNLEKRDDQTEGKQAIKVHLIGPSLHEFDINLKQWDMGDKSTSKLNENYVLVTTWNKVVKNSQLDEGMKVELWSFRRDGELCFALVNRGYGGINYFQFYL